MTEPPSPKTSTPWSVSGDEAAELMRLHREQLVAYLDIPAEPPYEGAKAEVRRSRELAPEEITEDVRELAAEYERSRTDVRLLPLRYITIGGPGGASVAGAAELPDDGLVSLVVTRTIVDGKRAEVTSRILVAKVVAGSDQVDWQGGGRVHRTSRRRHHDRHYRR